MTNKRKKKNLDTIKPGVNLNNRIAKRLPSWEVTNTIESKTGREVILFVDTHLQKELVSLLQNKHILKKFRTVVDFAKSDRYDKDIYGHEKNSERSKDVCAIKICVMGNHRIYCKEFFSPGVKKIVLIKYVYKKTNDFNNELRDMVDRIGSYQYEFKD